MRIFVDPIPHECSVIVSTLTASSPTKPFLLKVRIQENPEDPIPFSCTGQAFVDSSAMGNFVHPRLVTKFNIPTFPRPTPLRLQTVTGTNFHNVSQQVRVSLITTHGHEEVITLDIAPIGKHNIILGLLWCTYHEVQFDWNHCDIIQWSPSCENRCFQSHIVAPLLVQLMSPEAQIPKRATEGAIGYDLYTTETVTLPPATCALITTGLAIQLPEGTYGRIAPRSGLAVKHQIDTAAGVIDLDYCGEIKVVLVNNGPHNYTVTTGEQIAQLILENASLEDVVVTEFLSETARAQYGFGSTGMNEEYPTMNEELADIYAITLGHGAGTDIPSIDERYNKLRSQIPSEYHNYLDVFDSDLVMSKCPPSRGLYDFDPLILEGAKLPSPSRPYHLSQQEEEIMKEWLTGMIEAGMVTKCSNRCPTAAPLMFVRKKDSSKRLVIDYR